MGKAIDTSKDNLGYFNPPNVYRPAIIDIRLVGEYSAEDGATNTYRITQNDGKVFEFGVKNGSGGSAGRSVTSVEQIQISTESLGKNVARITLSDGTYTDVEIRNGAQGQTGPQGERGPAGIDQVEATVDNAVGTPSVDTSVVDGKLHLDFHNMKGVQGEPAVGIENYVTVEATPSTTAAADVLPPTGSADTLYRVARWDGAQYDTTVYSVYGWYDGVYKFLEKKEVGIDDEPTANSQNLVKSGGVAAKISQLGQIMPFYVGQYVDSTGAIVEGNTSWYSSEYLPINTMTIQEIELRVVSQASTVNYIAFYNSSFAFISGVNGSGADANNRIKQMPSIPSNAVYVKFTSVYNPPKVLGLCDNIGLSNCLGITHRINDVELDLKNVKHILNQYLDANGNVVTTPNAFIRTGFIKTANLTITAINVHIRSDAPSIGYICFYDANYTFISKVDGSSANENGNIVTVPSIPANAAYMRMCAWQNPILLTATYNSLLKANNVLYANENPIKHILGQYFDGDGNIGFSPNPFMRTGFIKTANLTITKIKVHIRPDVPTIGYISFFDDNFNFVSKVDGTNADANNDVTTIPSIPSEASYMAMCTYENPIIFEGYYYNEKLGVNDVLYARTSLDKPYQKVADTAVFLGDSISSVLGGSYGAPVGQLLQEWGVIGNVEIKAHAGDVILDGLTQLANATSVNPDIVFVAFGVNDWGLTELDGVGEWFTESTTEGVTKRSYDITANTIKSRFNQLYAAIKNKYPLARVVMQTVIKKGDNSRTEGGVYVYSPDYLTKNNNMYLDEIRGAILDMPRVCNVEAVDMWQLCGLDPTISANKSAYFVDFTHPNANGHKLMATAMYKYLISH